MNGAAVQAFPEGDGPDRLELNSGVGDVSLYFGGMAPPRPLIGMDGATGGDGAICLSPVRSDCVHAFTCVLNR